MRILRSFLLLVTSVLIPCSVLGQTADRDMQKESEIWESLQTLAPESVEAFKAGTEALDRGAYDEAVQLYERVYLKAPEYDVVQRRLGSSLVMVGRTAEGIALLETAVEKNRSPENLYSLASCLAYPPQTAAATAADKERAFSLAMAGSRADGGKDFACLVLVGQLALDLNREHDFREAATRLSADHPGKMATHYFGALLAAYDEDWVTAEEEIKEAENLGLAPDFVARFLASGVGTRAAVWRYAYYSLYLLGAWAAGLVLLFLLGKTLSTITIHSIENDDPNTTANPRQVTLRKLYSILINVAGLYYYLSIPFVLFLVLAVAGSIVYGFISAGRIPIKLVAIIGICALVTVFQMIRSLFIRRSGEDPGRKLLTEEAAGLWSLAREVAHTVGTRPIDEIRVTPGTELAVYEKGGFSDRAHDRARRVLLLGVGVLNGFSKNSFRAVLAHEYGHFSHRDTAGGDVALRVRSDMSNFALAMIQSGQAVWWNIAFQFLRAYDFIFRRISHGATRLQEVLADRVAVLNYGAAAFEKGLSHVIRRGVELEDIAYWEIANADKAKRPLQNLYVLTTESTPRIEEKVREAIGRPTSEDDTHPSPTDRFRYAERIQSRIAEPLDGMVWDLFANREALTSQMTALIQSNVIASAGEPGIE